MLQVQTDAGQPLPAPGVVAGPAPSGAWTASQPTSTRGLACSVGSLGYTQAGYRHLPGESHAAGVGGQRASKPRGISLESGLAPADLTRAL